jgi:para-aminobenzoate synthetase component 1
MEFKVENLEEFKIKALYFAHSFDVFCFLDSNNIKDAYAKFDALFAIGVRKEVSATEGNAFGKLEAFKNKNPGWLAGFLSYDLKNEIENLVSNNSDGLGFLDLYFFSPQITIIINGNLVEINGDNEQEIYHTILGQKPQIPPIKPNITLKEKFTKAEYLATVEKIKNHIQQGDIYVSNFCQEFFAEEVAINPMSIFTGLMKVSPTPFAALFKHRSQYTICASPERFLCKRGNKLVSQPIKGTAKRGKDIQEDEAIKSALKNNTKELQENVMIVDLVRNDLTRSAKQGTVKTEELFGIYSFNQVNQMISTISCELADDISEIQAIKNTFPMGSMTGAPKIKAMQLMEQYERSKRGPYSGAIGYFSPDGDFDFNVTIRSLFYNQQNKYLSFQVGSAITYHADGMQEYDECLLKAKAILEVLGE